MILIKNKYYKIYIKITFFVIILILIMTKIKYKIIIILMESIKLI